MAEKLLDKSFFGVIIQFRMPSKAEVVTIIIACGLAVVSAVCETECLKKKQTTASPPIITKAERLSRMNDAGVPPIFPAI